MKRMMTVLAAAVGVLNVLAGVEADQVRVTFYTPSIVRVTKTPEGLPIPPKPVPIVVAKPMATQPAAKNEDGFRVWNSGELVVKLNVKTGAVEFLNPDGAVLLREKCAAAFPTVKYGNIDAIRPTQKFSLPDDEEIYGLGDWQEVALNRRGHTRRLQIANLGDGLPYFCSPHGWSVYWDSTAPTWFRDTVGDSLTMESEIGGGVDYYFIRGGTLAGTVKGMRKLTGDAPMLPLDCYGFWQSRERYRNQEEIVGALRNYRTAGIPLDGIVQDWHYWGGNDTWNSMQFVTPDYSNPQLMVDAIHGMNAKVMISIWPSFGPATAQYREFVENRQLLPFETYPKGVRLYDCYSPRARETYFRYLKNLVEAGIDSWWMDASDTDQRYHEGDFEYQVSNGHVWREVINAYPYETCRGVYENLRARGGNRRPFILTRAGFPGQQRFGCSVWSGDIFGTWESLRRQIPSGVGFSLTGLPNWNCDIGGFIAGFYSWGTGGSTDNPAWRELYTRWMQYGAFLPMMRSHGTHIPRELYLYGRPGEPIYDALVGAVKLRYRLLPYIYSTAWQVTKNGASFMMPVDGRTDAYLFGDAFFVQPITDALYTKEARMVGPGMIDWVNDKTVTIDIPKGGKWRCYWDGKVVDGGQKVTLKVPWDSLSPAFVEEDGLVAPKDTDFTVKKDYRVKLPKGVWYDFATGERVEGGRTIVRKVGIDTIPAYVRAGSIIPIGPDVQYSGEKPWNDLEVRVYPGADGTFTLYEDAGDGFGYEKGEYTECVFTWNDRTQKLDIRDPKNRKFKVVVVK